MTIKNTIDLKKNNLNAQKNEIIVTNSAYCVSGGCTTLLMSESASKTWVTLAGAFGSIGILPSTTNGYRDIQHMVKKYPRDKSSYIAAQKFSWNGSGYIANGKLEPLP